MLKRITFSGLLFIGLIGLNRKSVAQETDPFRVALQNMNAFRPATGWTVAADAWANPNAAGAMTTTPGQGIVVVQNAGATGLQTQSEPGSVDLELDFMLSKGAKLNLLVQSRYGITLADSWGTAEATVGSCGAIQPVRSGTPVGQYGQAPRVNVCRAPGLWQHLRVVFDAPTFDAGGKKTTNARFAKVLLNGVLIHANAELPAPTTGATLADERPTGSLLLAPATAPVAFRNLIVRPYNQKLVWVEAIQYQAYEGEFTQLPDFGKLKPVRSGTTDRITWELAKLPNNYALQFRGTMRVTEPGRYTFELQSTNGSRLMIGDQTAVDHDGRHNRYEPKRGTVTLEAGAHPFVLSYFKSVPWDDAALGVFVESPKIGRQALHAASSMDERYPTEKITLVPNGESLLQRCFVPYRGHKKTHGVAVGEPNGLSYALDLAQGGLLYVARGEFVDVTTMWQGRGDQQLAYPLGSVIEFAEGPALAFLANTGAPWPDSAGAVRDVRFAQYALDEADRPAFTYRLRAGDVTDRLYPLAGNHGWARQLTVHQPAGTDNLWCRVASGQAIARMPNGTYAINDKTYYVELPAGAKPILRATAGGQELLLPVAGKAGETTLTYSIIW